MTGLNIDVEDFSEKLCPGLIRHLPVLDGGKL